MEDQVGRGGKRVTRERICGKTVKIKGHLNDLRGSMEANGVEYTKERKIGFWLEVLLSSTKEYNHC